MGVMLGRLTKRIPSRLGAQKCKVQIFALLLRQSIYYTLNNGEIMNDLILETISKVALAEDYTIADRYALIYHLLNYSPNKKAKE